MIKDYSFQKYEKLIVSEKGKIHQITIADIKTIYTEAGVSTIHKSDGNNIIVSKNLTFFEKELINLGFVKANRNEIINCTFISNFDLKNKKVKINNEIINISCRNLKKFIRILKNDYTIKS